VAPEAVGVADDAGDAAAVAMTPAEAVPKVTSAVKYPVMLAVWFACVTAAEPATGPETTPAAADVLFAWVRADVPE
jgi:hypothetical protein